MVDFENVVKENLVSATYDPTKQELVSKRSSFDFSMIGRLNYKYKKKKNPFDILDIMEELPKGAQRLLNELKSNMTRIDNLVHWKGERDKRFYVNMKILMNKGIVGKIDTTVFIMNPQIFVPPMINQTTVIRRWNDVIKKDSQWLIQLAENTSPASDE